MNIAITADMHLRTGGEYPERYNAFRNILEQLEAEHIDSLIIAGDLFDRGFHSYTEFERICKKYHNIQLHIIPGNHDPGIDSNGIVGGNIHIYTVPTVIEIGPATFALMPYLEKVNMVENIASIEKEIKGKEWVLIGHGDFYGGKKELNPLEPGTYMPLSRNNVKILNPRVVFLGHIHSPASWGNVYYAGSPCGLDIGETGKRRFLVYNTSDGSVDSRTVATDVLYFQETFIIVPMVNEVSLLDQEIVKRIQSWDIDPSDYSRVRVRVAASGYTLDRSAIFSTLKSWFDKFTYYNGEGPSIEQLFVSTDRQLNAVAERTMKLIDGLEWGFGGDEPTKDMLKVEALNLIYQV